MIPVFIFLAAILGVAFALRLKSKNDFIKEYFIGGRKLGGFVLAMTLVATYSSVSSFSAGPGMAWRFGFGWVYYASIQVVSMFLVLGVLGKKMALVAGKINAVTVIDIIRFRYGSNVLANISAVIMVVFFAATVTAQFIGGANIFSAAAGISYAKGLALFAVVAAASTAIGGFRGVAVTDTICAVVMLFGIGIIAAAILNKGGGLENIMSAIAEQNTNQQKDFLSPFAGGKISIPFLISQWLLCGFCTMGLPQSLVRNISYRDSKSLNRAIVYGTIVIGAMMIGMHLLGVLSRAIITELPEGKTTDAIIPILIFKTLPPAFAGFAIIGPLAASMSTVSSLLISAAAAIIKDMCRQQDSASATSAGSGAQDGVQDGAKFFSTGITFAIGLVCFIIALNPPSLVVWINLFAFGGLQSAFFWTFILGMFWKRANAAGAFWGMTGGVVVYCVCMMLRVSPGGLHQIVFGIAASLLFFIFGSFAGRQNPAGVNKVFFP